MLKDITPVVLSYNEEANLERTLAALSWANDVLVVDSFSDDASLEICEKFQNVRLIQRRFDDAASQCNFALEQNIQTEWVLSMDADYVVTKELDKEIGALQPPARIHGYEIGFTYLIEGQPLRGSLYPPRTCLYRRGSANYILDGHTQRVQIRGDVDKLKCKMLHDDRKPYSRWLHSQHRYAGLEAIKMRNTPWSKLSLQNKVRKLGLAPLLVVPYTLFAKALILDGIAGLRYTGQRFTAEMCLLKARLKSE